MRTFIALLLSAVLLSGVPLKAALPELSAKSAVVMAMDGTVAAEKDADSRRPMASTTKIMTALLAVESGRLAEVVTVPPEAAGVEGSSLYLAPGDRLTLESLVWAVMLASANDAAAAIAIHLGGSLEGFAAMMNDRARAMGLENTHFTNPHGLYDENHYTTARELALLAAEALKNETFRTIAASPSHTVEVNERARPLQNHNKMLRLYEGAVGVKTGFTKKSGRCLVSAAERDGLMLVAVTLDAPDDWKDHRVLLDFGFSALESLPLISPGECACILPCIGGNAPDITVKNREALCVVLPKGEHRVTRELILPRYFWAPVEKDAIVGKLVFREGDTILGEVPLYAETGSERVPVEKNFFEKIFE